MRGQHEVYDGGDMGRGEQKILRNRFARQNRKHDKPGSRFSDVSTLFFLQRDKQIVKLLLLLQSTVPGYSSISPQRTRSGRIRPGNLVQNRKKGSVDGAPLAGNDRLNGRSFRSGLYKEAYQHIRRACQIAATAERRTGGAPPVSHASMT